MSRNDSVLYTATSSASLTTPRTTEVREKQEANKQKRLDQQHKMKPAADVVLPIIHRHKLKAKYVENVAISELLTDKAAGELLRSQKKLYKALTEIENELRIALRDVA